MDASCSNPDTPNPSKAQAQLHKRLCTKILGRTVDVSTGLRLPPGIFVAAGIFNTGYTLKGRSAVGFRVRF